ncbi:MAG: hypothetical protein M0R03_06750 [Novosphingobium sp.]|nr:hypothetical protein [Novosphingobium sp.]
MLQDNRSNLVQPVAAPQHVVQPTTRELRSQAIHRLQVGLFGLAAMLLLVSLANIIMDRARLAEEEQAAPPVAVGTSEAKKAASDPLADIGVIPAANPSASAGQAK